MDKPTGTRETYSFEIPLEFENVPLSSNISGKVEIMKIEEGFNAKITEVKTTLELVCHKCLKKISQDVNVDMAERQFLMERPAEVRDENDLYLVHKKDLTIDLGEFLRQEIILHFPLIPVCSKSCKGLCSVCGKDRNKKNCHCREEKIEEEKPLAILKQLLKNK
ncbi:DUF177 domain-containing protein [Candidatus Peregrinibacteria bacterium]|nr:DUF177 domain-containing protein [Candidatus Peregrinibacteria bacterium]